MEETVTKVLLFGGIAAIPILMIVRTILGYLKKRSAWQKTANQLGFQWKEDGEELVALHRKLRIFSVRGERVLQNYLRGLIDNTEIALCDYIYRAHQKAMSAPEQTIAVLSDKRLRLPHFVLRPRSVIWDTLGRLFESGEITFPEDVHFSNSFHLEGDVKVHVCELFTKDLRELIVSMNIADYYIEGEDNVLLIHPGKFIDPPESEELLKKGQLLVKILVEICTTANLT